MLLLAGRLSHGPVSFSVVRKKWTYRAYRIKRRPMGCSTVSKVSQNLNIASTYRSSLRDLLMYLYWCEGKHVDHNSQRRYAKPLSALRRVSLRFQFAFLEFLLKQLPQSSHESDSALASSCKKWFGARAINLGQLVAGKENRTPNLPKHPLHTKLKGIRHYCSLKSVIWLQISLSRCHDCHNGTHLSSMLLIPLSVY